MFISINLLYISHDLTLDWRQLNDFYLQNLKTGHIKYGIGKKYTFQADAAANISSSYSKKKGNLSGWSTANYFRALLFICRGGTRSVLGTRPHQLSWTQWQLWFSILCLRTNWGECNGVGHLLMLIINHQILRSPGFSKHCCFFIQSL